MGAVVGYWELLGDVGICWGKLGAVGSGEKKQAVGLCPCCKHPRKSKGGVHI